MMEIIKATSRIHVEKSQEGFLLVFYSSNGSRSAVLNLNDISDYRSPAVKRTMLAALKDAFKPKTFTREMSAKGEDPVIGALAAISKLESNAEILEEVGGVIVEVVAQTLNADGRDCVLFRWFSREIGEYQYRTLLAGKLNFTPVDNRTDEQKLHDDLVAVMTEDGVLRGDKSIASEAIARVIDSGKFTVGYK